MTGQLQRLGVDYVDICRGDRKNDAIGFGNIFGYEVPGLFLDIAWLVADGDL